MRFLRRSPPFLLLLAAAAGCGSPSLDLSTQFGKGAIVDEVNDDLSTGNCNGAFIDINPVYESANTDDQIRMLMASTYGCIAGVNFFPDLVSLGKNGANLVSPSAVWAQFAKLFPSTAISDKVVEAAEAGSTALMSIWQAAFVPTDLQITIDQFNTGSMLYTDRTTDSNIYLVFLSMALIGGQENRFGAPDPTTYAPTASPPLPWTTAATVDADGCAYASAVINLIDGLKSASVLSGSLANIANTINSVIDGPTGACALGCQNSPFPNTATTGCTAAIPCTSCPLELRDRSQCKGVSTDVVSCAAAGIVNLIGSVWGPLITNN
jgi:hypothetical protein